MMTYRKSISIIDFLLSAAELAELGYSCAEAASPSEELFIIEIHGEYYLIRYTFLKFKTLIFKLY